MYCTAVFSAASTAVIIGGPVGLTIGVSVGTIVREAAEDIDWNGDADETVQSDIDEITLKRSVKESLVGLVSGSASVALAKRASTFVMGDAESAVTNAVMVRVQRRLVEEGFDEVSDQTVTT